MAENQNYDQALAQRLGADDYGMKKYIFVILKTGSNISQDKEYINRIFSGHMDNIRKLVDEGKLILAGPLAKNENSYRGLFILDVRSSIEAMDLLQSDPAIKEGFLYSELYEWYGSAALPLYLPESEKIWKQQP